MEENNSGTQCCRLSWKDSITNTAKKLLENPTIAPSHIAAERMTICESCDEYNPRTTLCSACHCIMPLKTSFANMGCPLKKWEEWEVSHEGWKTAFSGSTWQNGNIHQCWHQSMDIMVTKTARVHQQTIRQVSCWAANGIGILEEWTSHETSDPTARVPCHRASNEGWGRRHLPVGKCFLEWPTKVSPQGYCPSVKDLLPDPKPLQ